jgi:hypothetical protein
MRIPDQPGDPRLPGAAGEGGDAAAAAEGAGGQHMAGEASAPGAEKRLPGPSQEVETPGGIGGNTISESTTALADCPELEDLAAFLDGKLTAEERARITDHLANCESCYEVFAGTARFLEDTRDQQSLPPPHQPVAPQRPFERWREPRAPRFRRRWVTAAAAAGLMAATAGLLLFWQGGWTLSTEQLASLVGGPVATAAVPWEGKVVRGEQEVQELPPEVGAFRLGVRFLDLHLALASGDKQRADEALRRLDNLLKDVELLPSETRTTFGAMRKSLQQGAAPRSFLADAGTREKKAIKELLVEPRFIELGSWTEACRLAGASGRPDLFRERATRRLLDQAVAARPKDEGALDPRAVEDLRAIREELLAGRIDAAALGQRCHALLKLLDY